MALRGNRKDGDGIECPVRRCIASGERAPRDAMLRFVLDPEDEVVPDLSERLPGRGFWLQADRDMIERAASRNLFARAAKAPVRVPGRFADRVEAALARRCLDWIGLARRAGQAFAGRDKVRARLELGGGGLLVAAADGSGPERAKLRALAPCVPTVNVLKGDELGQAFGRERVVHAFVAEGTLADRLVREAGRLSGVRQGDRREAVKAR